MSLSDYGMHLQPPVNLHRTHRRFLGLPTRRTSRHALSYDGVAGDLIKCVGLSLLNSVA